MLGHKIINQNGIHFLTMTIVGWINILDREEYKQIIIESFKFCQINKGLAINAFVIMSNHIHLICFAKEHYALSDVIRDFKKFTSKAIIDKIIESSTESRKAWILDQLKKFGTANSKNKTFQLWQNDNKPIELVTEKWTKQKLAYIHLNPVRYGYVAKAEHYLYSSAVAYIGLEGLVELELLDV